MAVQSNKSIVLLRADVASLQSFRELIVSIDIFHMNPLAHTETVATDPFYASMYLHTRAYVCNQVNIGSEQFLNWDLFPLSVKAFYAPFNSFCVQLVKPS